MNRDELVAVGAMAIQSHDGDGLCPLCHLEARAVVDAVEQLIRADERERVERNHRVTAAWARGEERADLRDKVEALSGLLIPGSTIRWLNRDDVLALFDGRSE